MFHIELIIEFLENVMNNIVQVAILFFEFVGVIVIILSGLKAVSYTHLDAVRTVSKGVEEYQKDKKGALLIITHSTRILESLHVDKTHVLVNGKIVASGDASLVDEINEHGFERFLEA